MQKSNHMKKLLLFIALMFAASMLQAKKKAAQQFAVEHVHPTCWWAGMKNPSLQILLHGRNIAKETVALEGTNGIALRETKLVSNPNYIVLYLDTKGAPAQRFNIVVGKTRIPYELKERKAMERKSYDASDVVYLLMPDRFANGDTSNDDIAGMREQEKSDPKVPLSRHGGDLKGMTDHLDYLAELGITAIWPTPTLVNDMPLESYHGYAITNYYETDPRLGTNEDYCNFVSEAHKRGLKVIQDMVFNHCGRYNFIYQDLPDKDWFNFDSEYVQTSYKTGAVGDVNASKYNQKRTVDGWFVESMPDWNQRNRLVRDYLIQTSLWWIEYAGIDGIRQDTYPYNDFDSMVEWCKRIELDYPGMNIVGEAWINNNVGVAYWQKDSKLAAPRNSLLPTVMDFPLMSLLNWTIDQETDDWDHGYAKLYDYLSQDVVFQDVNHLLTFLDNHDTDRFQKNEEMTKDTTRYKHALTLLLTLRGIPQLYYGDEVGMAANKGVNDGVLRQGFPGGWKHHSHNAFTEEGRTNLENWYYHFTQNLLQWRKTNEAVHFGKLTHFCIQNGVYAYARRHNGKTVFVLLNGTSKEQTISLEPYAEVIPGNTATDVLTHREVRLHDSLTFAPREVLVLDF